MDNKGIYLGTAKVTSERLDEFGILKPIDEYRENLDRQQTMSEKSLWKFLVAVNYHERVKTQFVFGFYILDFLFLQHGVAVELDGSSHDNKKEYDKSRDMWIEECGLTVLRYSNDIAMRFPETILNDVKNYEPKMPLHKIIVRAQTFRQAYNERKLAAKGLKHGTDGKLIPLSQLTKRQSKYQIDLVKIFDAPIGDTVNKAKCPLCKNRLRSSSIRCAGCGAIVRRGWIEEIPFVKSSKSLANSKKREKKKSRNALAINQVIPPAVEYVTIKKGRVVSGNSRVRPKCPNCSCPVASTWKECHQCKSPIVWT